MRPHARHVKHPSSRWRRQVLGKQVSPTATGEATPIHQLDPMALVSVRSLRRLAPTALCSLLALARGGGAAAGDGEEARWLVQASTWATMAWMEGGELKSLVTSMAESDGRLFFYLMENATFPATITLSEAQVDPSQYFGARCGPDGALDPQDPVSRKGRGGWVLQAVIWGGRAMSTGPWTRP